MWMGVSHRLGEDSGNEVRDTFRCGWTCHTDCVRTVEVRWGIFSGVVECITQTVRGQRQWHIKMCIKYTAGSIFQVRLNSGLIQILSYIVKIFRSVLF